MPLLVQKFKQLCFIWWLVTLCPSSCSYSRGLQWSSGFLDWAGLDRFLIWLSSNNLIAVSHGAWEKPVLQVWEHCQSRRKHMFFQGNLVCGLSHVSFTKTDLPDCDFDESSLCLTIRGPGGAKLEIWRGLEPTVSHTHCEIWWRIGADLGVLQ